MQSFVWTEPDRGQVPPGLAVVADSLTKRFGSVLAVDSLSFGLAPGTITGFLGPNGAGKTTTLRMLLGLIKPSGGKRTDLRLLLRGPSRSRPCGSARFSESTDFHPGRSGRDHLRMLSRAARLPDARVDEVLRLVELEGSGASSR